MIGFKNKSKKPIKSGLMIVGGGGEGWRRCLIRVI